MVYTVLTLLANVCQAEVKVYHGMIVLHSFLEQSPSSLRGREKVGERGRERGRERERDRGGEKRRERGREGREGREGEEGNIKGEHAQKSRVTNHSITL